MPIFDITVSSGELYKHAYKLCYNSRNILFNMRGKIKLVRRFQQTSGYITNYLGNTILSSVLLILRKKMSAILCMPIFNAIQILQKMGFHYRQVFFLEKKWPSHHTNTFVQSLNLLIKNERKTIAFFYHNLYNKLSDKPIVIKTRFYHSLLFQYLIVSLNIYITKYGIK